MPTRGRNGAGQPARFTMKNGLRTFALHATQGGTAATLRPDVGGAPRNAAGESELASLDPETVAHYYLNNALQSEALPTFAVTEVNGDQGEFKSMGVETIFFAGTRTVKFRQHYRKIPVYGSLVTVELDEANQLVSLNSALGTPENVDPVAAVSPAQALDTARTLAGYGTEQLDGIPRLYYYFDVQASRWRLTYIIEDVLKRSTDESADALPEYVDYVIDAHSGALVAELPRTQTLGGPALVELAFDELGAEREILVQPTNNGLRRLFDSGRNVHTHDFEFRDARFLSFLLPGRYVENPPNPWQSGAVSAHANSEEVVAFLQNVLMRNGLDNQGGPVVSSVNCLWSGQSNGKEWHNAARIPGQMIYGQRLVNGQLVSYAAARDVVAHELLHGLTDHTARLEYLFESGALNESYSDIFGVIVTNLDVADLQQWDWEMGEDLSNTGTPLRDLARPGRFFQPEHMNDYRFMPKEKDHGGVHTNSGIHNKAAFLLITARDAADAFLFDGVTVARLFYMALSQHLSRTSGFADSRRGVLTSAMTLLRNDPRRIEKLTAVAQAFDAVGIVDATP